jgi:hypothetical protein
MVNRVLLVVVFVPLAVVLVALAVANRAATAFTLDPFNPGNPALTLQAPLFVWLFAALALGAVLGSLITWAKQGRYRRMAHQRGLEAERLRQTFAARGPVAPRAPALPRA